MGAAACGAWASLTGRATPGGAWQLAQVAALFLLSAAHVSRGSAKRASVSLPRLSLLLAFGASAGVNVGSWITSALLAADACPLRRRAVDLDACGALARTLTLQACALTAGLYAAFAAAALMAPPQRGQGRHLALCVVAAGTWLLLGAQLCARLGWASQLAADVYVRLGLVVHAARIYVDTGALAERVRAEGDADVVGHAVNVVANTLQLFIRVITLLAQHLAKQKREEEEEAARKAGKKRT